MITSYEVSSLLRNEIPQLTNKPCPSKVSLEVYAFMNYFSDYTSNAVKEHHYAIARKCFALAEKLFSQGDKIVRMLIENVFVFSFSSFLTGDAKERKIITTLIPGDLYSLYIKQVTQPGC